VTNAAGLRGRLHTAFVGRLKVTYNFDAWTSLRVIGQWVGTDHNPVLDTFPGPETEGVFTGSALFAYRRTGGSSSSWATTTTERSTERRSCSLRAASAS
jgi:hypothetical protein